MTKSLLLVALGPVQDFIAQARRTRDLWYGSHLLSELGRCAARALVDGGAQLIVPALRRGDPELVPCAKPLRAGGQPPMNIGNKLLAEVPEELDPHQLLRNVRESVQRFWVDEIARPVKDACEGLLADDIDAVWNEQIGSFLEFTAAWTPYADYRHSRIAVEQAVAARKTLRDFAPWKHLRGAVPKSSLDGVRETVLRKHEKRDSVLVQRLRIASAEQLDAVGLVKRSGGKPDQFVPIVNVACATWLAIAEQQAPAHLGALCRACRDLKVAPVTRDIPCVRPFPFDASLLLRSRWAALFAEQALHWEAGPKAWGRENVRPLLSALGEPYPYVACLVADGDRMGHAIGTLEGAEDHRAFSRALAEFAREARRVVEENHRGSLVYAGGDDVLAFLPLPEALACANELRQRFAQLLPTGSAPTAPTLSVGIGIGHVMEAMGDLLELGREAEREAKGGASLSPDRRRNALAVVVDKRSGGHCSWRARWDAWNGDPVGRLRADAALLRTKLSWRKVHEIARLLARLPEPSASRGAEWASLLVLETQRSLKRVHGEGGVEPTELGLALEERSAYSETHNEVSTWVNRMLIARAFADAEPRGLLRAEETAA